MGMSHWRSSLGYSCLSWITITAVGTDDAVCILMLLSLANLADLGEVALACDPNSFWTFQFTVHIGRVTPQNHLRHGPTNATGTRITWR